MMKQIVCIFLCMSNIPLLCMEGEARELSKKESKEEIARAIQQVVGQQNPKIAQAGKPLLHRAFALTEKAITDNTAPVDSEAQTAAILLQIRENAAQGWQR